ncbi:MAG: endolytic transglycosylase MltG [Candidatus Firestonebacteria bacterium]|nr:endolytic transglycosylase MltG [Candidatus Firestonebacteria bacterium]
MLLFSLTFILAVLAVGGGLLRFYFWSAPAASTAYTVDIPPKSGTLVIGQKLQAAGVVRHAGVFRYYAFLSGQARRLKAGEYAFPSGVTLPQVVRQLVLGQIVQHPFLVPEGYTAKQIADKLEAEGLAKAADFLGVVDDANAASTWEVPARTLEGFLFPDTYELTKGMSASQIAHEMVKRFKEKAGSVLPGAPLAPLPLVTLASIIEREVKAPAERPRVASVFYNRLAKRMRLESCATVLYGLGRAGGALSLDDLQSASPYNTYRHAGLPPAPISNPGLSALQAAAHPDQSEYLFFVVAGDGTHIFSKDFESHKKAKWAHKKARRPLQP